MVQDGPQSICAEPQDRVCFSDSLDRSVTESLNEDVYEGVEKKLILKYSGVQHFSIRKTIKENIWKKVVESVDAKILSVIRNDYIDAYLLSESSLFVLNDRIFLKTCGKTRIFNSVEVIVSNIAREIPEINLEEVIYSRPTFMFPEHQFDGYDKGFENEVEFLRTVTMKATDKAWDSSLHTGDGVIFHSCTLSRHSESPKHLNVKGVAESVVCKQVNQTMDLALFNVDALKMKYFFGQKGNVLQDSCLREFLPTDSPSLKIDDYNFEPCGYSLNAIDDEFFWCIHITPEAQYSYVSFETNHPSASYIYQKLQDFYSPDRAVVLWTVENRDDRFIISE